MTIKQIVEKSSLPIEVAESLYWHCLWIRTVPTTEDVMWYRLLNDEKYRRNKEWINTHF